MAEKQSFSIKGNRKNKALVEHVAEAVFTVCALLAVVAVALLCWQQIDKLVHFFIEE